MGSAESEEYDQVLDSVLVGPVPAGRHMFVFQVSKRLSDLTVPLSDEPVCVDNVSHGTDLLIETLTSESYFCFSFAFSG